MLQKKSSPLYYRLREDQINRTTGLISGIVILEEGKDKYGENWDEIALGQIATLGNAQKMGVKSRFGHPNMCESALGSFIGRYKNFRVGQITGQARKAVLADLQLEQVAKSAPKWGNLYDYVLDMSLNHDDMFGNSIVYMPGEQEAKNEPGDEGKDQTVYYERVDSLIASDLVDSPAATTSLFKEFTNIKDFSALATRFLEENPELANIITENEVAVKEFITKYKKNKNMATTKPVKKSLRERIKEAQDYLKKLVDGEDQKDFDMTCADGSTVTITDTDGDGVPSPGDMVKASDGSPMVSANIPMEDGTTIHTDDKGAITTIDPAPAEGEETPPAAPPAAKSTADELAQKQAELEAEKKAHKETQDDLEEALVTMKGYQDRLAKYKSDYKPPVSGTQFKAPKEEKPLSAEERKQQFEDRQKELADRKAAEKSKRNPVK